DKKRVIEKWPQLGAHVDLSRALHGYITKDGNGEWLAMKVTDAQNGAVWLNQSLLRPASEPILHQTEQIGDYIMISSEHTMALDFSSNGQYCLLELEIKENAPRNE